MSDSLAIPLSEALVAFRWMALCVIVSAVATPLVLRLFRGLPDRGVGLAPLVGILLLTTMSWWMGQGTSPFGSERARVVLAIVALGIGALVLWGVRSELRSHGAKILTRGPVFSRLLLPATLLLVALLPLPFSRMGILWVLILLAALSALAWRGDLQELKRLCRRLLPPGGVALLLFTAGFWVFLLLRAQFPGVHFGAAFSGAEKPGNLMHLSSAMQTRWFPVADAWFFGEPVNYYNGGHIAVATLAKASAVSPAYAFNLGLATLFGLTLSTAFSLAYNVLHRRSTSCWRTIPWAVFGATAVAVFGNGDALHQVMERTAGVATFDFWRSSRVYTSRYSPIEDSGTITEFPVFSALLGDLHPHHMALPIGMLVASILLLIWQKTHSHVRHPAAWWSRSLPDLLLLGLAMAAALVVNTWDAIFYSPIVLIVLIVCWSHVRRSTATTRQLVWPILSLAFFCVLSIVLSGMNIGGFFVPLVTLVALGMAITLGWWVLRSEGGLRMERMIWGVVATAVAAIAALLVALPHLMVFQSPLSPSNPLLAVLFPPRLSNELFAFPDLLFDSLIKATPLRVVPVPLRTGLWEYLTLWGLFVLPIAFVLLTRLVKSARHWRADQSVAAVLGLIALFGLAWNMIGALAGPFVLLMALGCFTLAATTRPRSGRLIWLLLGSAFLWHLFVEILYFDDAYEGHRVRYNTPFKLLYPSWPLMAVGMAASLRQLPRLLGEGSLRVRGLQLLFVVVILRIGLIYPVEGTLVRLREDHPVRGTLDALAHLDADERVVMEWMRTTLPRGGLVLEAPPRADSSSYAPVGRFAAATGYPTLVGWSHHELQWRGWNNVVSDRLLDRFQLRPETPPTLSKFLNAFGEQADRLYRAPGLEGEALILFSRLGIDHVVVGVLERERYGSIDGALEKFEELEVVFRSGDVILYRVPEAGRQ